MCPNVLRNLHVLMVSNHVRYIESCKSFSRKVAVVITCKTSQSHMFQTTLYRPAFLFHPRWDLQKLQVGQSMAGFMKRDWTVSSFHLLTSFVHVPFSSCIGLGAWIPKLVALPVLKHGNFWPQKKTKKRLTSRSNGPLWQLWPLYVKRWATHWNAWKIQSKDSWNHQNKMKPVTQWPVKIQHRPHWNWYFRARLSVVQVAKRPRCQCVVQPNPDKWWWLGVP